METVYAIYSMNQLVIVVYSAHERDKALEQLPNASYKRIQ